MSASIVGGFALVAPQVAETPRAAAASTQIKCNGYATCMYRDIQWTNLMMNWPRTSIRYNLPSDMNNAMSSIINKDAYVNVYDLVNFQGQAYALGLGGYLDFRDFGFNDKTSSLIIRYA